MVRGDEACSSRSGSDSSRKKQERKTGAQTRHPRMIEICCQRQIRGVAAWQREFMACADRLHYSFHSPLTAPSVVCIRDEISPCAKDAFRGVMLVMPWCRAWRSVPSSSDAASGFTSELRSGLNAKACGISAGKRSLCVSSLTSGECRGTAAGPARSASFSASLCAVVCPSGRKMRPYLRFASVVHATFGAFESCSRISGIKGMLTLYTSA